MRPMIKKQTVSLFLRQTYNVSTKQLFEDKALLQLTLPQLFQEFTGCKVNENGELSFLNPYSEKPQKIENLDILHISSEDILMNRLVEVHRERMSLLEQSLQQTIVPEQSNEVSSRVEELKGNSIEIPDQDIEH